MRNFSQKKCMNFWMTQDHVEPLSLPRIKIKHKTKSENIFQTKIA